MMKKAAARLHTVQDAFVFFLLGIFAFFSVCMVLFSAGMYKNIRTSSAEIAAERSLDPYIVNAVRAHDASGNVTVQERSGVKALVLTSIDDDGEYETLIYHMNDSVYEMFQTAGSEFMPEYGEVIAPASAFLPEISNGFVNIRIVRADGTENTHSVALRSCGKEG